MSEGASSGAVRTVLVADAPIAPALVDAHRGAITDAPPRWFAATFPTASAAVAAATAAQSAAPTSRAAIVTGEAPAAGIPSHLIDDAVRRAGTARPGHTVLCAVTAALTGDRRELIAPTTPVAMPVGSGVAGLDTSGPFVGRDAEMARVLRAWDDAVAGNTRVLLVAGEPGIGKTRLAAEIATEVRLQGGMALFGRNDDGLAVPYQPFVEALRALARRVPPLERAAVLGRLVPELAPPGTSLGAPDAADAELDRWRLYEAITGYLRDTSAHRPLLLVLDDMHWATPLTVALAQHVLRGLGGTRICAMTTFRSTELAGTPWAASIGELVRLDGVEQLTLTGLDEPAVAAMLGDTADGSPVSAASLLARTRGNPLFVRELAAHLSEGGSVDGPLPIGVREVILQRIARLPDPAHEVLTTAAIAGDPFRLAVVERVIGGDALPAVEAALRAGLLHEDEGDALAFSHALVRDALITELLATRQAQLHLRVARAIESLPGAAAHAEALAHHYHEGAALGGGADAARWAQIAGRRALERLAFEESLHFVDIGLASLAHARTPEHSPRGRLLLIRSAALAAALDQAGFREAAGQAAEAARSAGDPELLAAAAIQYNRWVSFGRPDPADRRLLDDALAAVSGNDSLLSTRALLLSSRARYRVWAEYAVDAAARDAEQARRLARDSGDDGAVAEAAHATFVTLQGSPDARGQLAAIDEALGAAHRVGQPRALWYEHRAEANLRLGRRDDAEEDVRRLAERAQGGGDNPIKVESVLLSTTFAMLDGRWAEAEALANEGLALETPWWEIPLAFSSQLAIMAWEQNGAADYVPLLEAAAKEYTEVPTLRAGLALVAAQTGKQDIAEKAVASLTRDFDALPHGINRAPTLCMLAGAVVALGDVERAAAIEQALVSHAGLAVVYPNASYCVGAADRFLGSLSLLLGRPEEAVVRAEAALSLDKRLRSAPLTARSQLGLAQALTARGNEGDTNRAQRLAAEAHDTAQRLGMVVLAAEARPITNLG